MMHDIGVFFGIVFVLLLFVGAAVHGWNYGAEKARIQDMENENRELINKALKHYAETKGIK
jgi:hypothetical protein